MATPVDEIELLACTSLTLGKRLAASLSAASKCSQTLKPVQQHAAKNSIREGIKILIMLFDCSNRLHSAS